MSTGSCLPCVGYRMKAAWLTGTVVCLLAAPHNRPLAQAMNDDITLSGHQPVASVHQQHCGILPVSSPRQPGSQAAKRYICIVKAPSCVVCEVLCYTEARPGLSGKKMRWHFSKQQGCSLGLDVSVSRRSRDVVSKCLGLVETWEGVGLDLVSD